MVRRRLPIGLQTFRKLREQDCYYVDKTAYVERLLDEGTHYFLSRPRRFGKSLGRTFRASSTFKVVETIREMGWNWNGGF